MNSWDTITWFNEDFAEYMDTYTVDSLLTDTSLKGTPRVGPCLSLLPLFDSL